MIRWCVREVSFNWVNLKTISLEHDRMARKVYVIILSSMADLLVRVVEVVSVLVGASWPGVCVE